MNQWWSDYQRIYAPLGLNQLTNLAQYFSNTNAFINAKYVIIKGNINAPNHFPVSGGIPTQMATNAEIVSMSWRQPLRTWWLHQMETFSALLTICAGNSPVTGEFPVQKPVTRSCAGFFDLRLNKRLSKHSWGWWVETPPRSLWLHYNEIFCCQNGGHFCSNIHQEAV